jgi:hypothetical protein
LVATSEGEGCGAAGSGVVAPVLLVAELDSPDTFEAVRRWCSVGLLGASFVGAESGVLLLAVAAIAGVVMSAGMFAFAAALCTGGAGGEAGGCCKLLLATSCLVWGEPE